MYLLDILSPCLVSFSSQGMFPHQTSFSTTPFTRHAAQTGGSASTTQHVLVDITCIKHYYLKPVVLAQPAPILP